MEAEQKGLSRRMAIAIALVGVLIVIAALAASGRGGKKQEPCPYIGTPAGSALSGNERAWAVSTLGQATVDRCWPNH